MLILGRFAMVIALLAIPHGARADESNVLAPFRFQPPPQQQLAPLDQEKAFAYRSQILGQLRRLELDESGGRLDSFDQRLLLDTRAESMRMNDVLGY